MPAAAAGRGRLFSAAGRGRGRAGGIGCGAPSGVPAAIASAAIAARCSARRPRSRRIAAACLATSARKPTAALTQQSVVLLQIPSGPQKHRPASPVVMIRMPDVGLGALAAALPLAVTAPKNREMIPRIFFSREDIVMLCCLVSGKTSVIPF